MRSSAYFLDDPAGILLAGPHNAHAALLLPALAWPQALLPFRYPPFFFLHSPSLSFLFTFSDQFRSFINNHPLQYTDSCTISILIA